jgi:hypothetical protein
MELFAPADVSQVRDQLSEIVMKDYFTRMSPTFWMLAVVPAVMIAYTVASIVVPAVIHAVIPDVVRTVLTVL